MHDTPSPPSIHAFLDTLEDELQVIARQRGIDLNKHEGSGYAFSLWTANLLMRGDESLRADLDDVVSRGGSDLGCDVVLADDAGSTLIVVQAKFQGLAHKARPLHEDALIALARRHHDLLSEEFIAKGSEHARELLGGYSERFREGYQIRFYFVTTGKATDRHDLLVTEQNHRYENANVSVTVELLDRGRLRDFYTRTESLERSVPDSIEIDLPKEHWFIHDGDNPCLVAVIKGNEIRNQYKRQGRKESLFAWNIRNYLGDRGINKGIKETAESRPNDFVYFNNGITLVCQDFELEGNHLVINKPQIINGAQTVASLAVAPENADVSVLFRLVQTGSTSSARSLDSEIIRANNSQNRISLSDFRSNDRIQVWLEKTLPREKASALLGRVIYKSKRAARAATGDRIIALEEFAKIRYAYLHEPLAVHADPKSLWTQASAGGRYESALGIEGELLDVWPKAVLKEALFAVALHDAAQRSGAEERQVNETLTYMKGLRFHAVALAGIYFREKAAVPGIASLLSNQERFQSEWETIWDAARDVLFGQYELHVQKGRISLFAFKRSSEVWEAMKKGFRFKFRIARLS